jgi:hypothetical protein
MSTYQRIGTRTGATSDGRHERRHAVPMSFSRQSPTQSSARPGGTAWRVVWLALTLAAWLGLGLPEAAAQTCPATDPNQNYNCPIGPDYLLPGWGNVPWSLPSYYQTIHAGDLDGDGTAELLGRDASGIQIWSFNPTLGVWQPVLTTDGSGVLGQPYFSDGNGWGAPQYYQTIRLADVDGQRGQELVARSGNGVVVFQFTKGSLSGSSVPTGS